MNKAIFYLILLFLPTQLGRHFWPPFSYVSAVRVDYLSPTIYLTDILIFVLFLSLLLSKSKILHLKSHRDLWSHRDPWSYILNLRVILLLVFLLIGIALSKSPLAGAYGFIKLLEFIFLGVYISKASLKLVTLAQIFAVGILAESLLAIAQFIQKSSIGGVFYFFGERTFSGDTPGIANAALNGELVLRPYGTFSHPNVLAGYLTIAMAMVIFNPTGTFGFQFPITNVKKIFYNIALAVGTVALFLTMSRIAIAIWIFILLFYITKFLLNKFSSFISILVVLVLIGSICSIIALSPLSSRFALKLTDESILVRQDLIDSSFKIITTHPLFGVGLNNFLVHLSEVQKINPSATFSLQPVHNIYLLVLAETGIVGFGFFMWFLWKVYEKIKSQKIKITLLGIVLILGLFDHYFLTLQQGQLLLCFVLGFCWNRFVK